MEQYPKTITNNDITKQIANNPPIACDDIQGRQSGMSDCQNNAEIINPR
jgi:hypothetical protein